VTKRIFKYQTHLAWAGLVLVMVFLRPPARNFVYVNEAINATVADQVLMGGKLYHDAADWKGPLGYLLYAGILQLGGRSLVALHLFGLLMMVFITVCAAQLARALSGPQAGLLTGLMTVVFLSHAMGPSVEMDLFMATFTATAYLCFAIYLLAGARRRTLPLLSGFLLVLAISCKPTAALDAVALAVAAVVLTRSEGLSDRARAGLWLGLVGAALAMAAVAVLILRYSSFRDVLAWAWVIPSVGQNVGFGGRIRSFVQLLTAPVAVTALIWGFAIPAAIYYIRRPKQMLPDRSAAVRLAGSRMLPVWALATVIGSFVGEFALPYHCTQAVVPLSILAAIGVTGLMKVVETANWRSYLIWAVTLSLLLTMAAPLRHAAWLWRDRVFNPPTTDRNYLAGAQLARLTNPDERALVMEHNPSVLFWAKRRSASRYLMLEHLWSQIMIRQLPRFESIIGEIAHPRQLFLKDVRMHRPKFILLPEAEWFRKEVNPPGNQDLLDQVLEGYSRVDTSYGYQWYIRGKQ